MKITTKILSSLSMILFFSFLVFSLSIKAPDVYEPDVPCEDRINSTKNLGPGTIISWNTDSLNENGVAISVEYYAVNQLDTEIAFANTATIKRNFVIDDSLGTYNTFSQEYLEILPKMTLLDIPPKMALLDINVLRAGFDTDENSDMSITGMTKVGVTKLAKY